jgi:hypothetical protein
MKDTDNCCARPRFYWSAVIVAALIGVGLSFLFTLLCLAFGFTAFSMTAAETAFSIGGFIALSLAAIVSMFSVGWVAGYMAKPFCTNKCFSSLYGLTAWCLTLVLSILVASSMEKMIDNTAYLVNKNATPITFVVANKIADKIPAMKKQADPVKTAEILAMTHFVTFFIFFIGALVSSFGARCAVQLSRSE